MLNLPSAAATLVGDKLRWPQPAAGIRPRRGESFWAPDDLFLAPEDFFLGPGDFLAPEGFFLGPGDFLAPEGFFLGPVCIRATAEYKGNMIISATIHNEKCY